MLVRRCLLRFGRIKRRKKDKEKWGSIDEWKNEKKLGYYDPINNPVQNPSPWLTADKIRHLVKLQENAFNSNRISVPISAEDKKKLGEFKMHFQYHQVTVKSTRDSEKLELKTRDSTTPSERKL